ncbi:MAG: hypothetical protein ACT4N8_07535 [Sphingosinicella sp.]|uniref:hypothetical protein n=1 Tax=Sphingosinicella sp. TaxID=1917971 RepID=UPI0040384962
MRRRSAGAWLAAGAAAGAALVFSAVPGAAWDEPKGKAGKHDRYSLPTQVPEAGEPPEISYRGCATFEEEDYRGRRVDVRAEASVEWVGADRDNSISSLACASGCRLLAYARINFGGARRSYRGAARALGEWNDRISALRVICAGDAPLIHQGH